MPSDRSDPDEKRSQDVTHQDDHSPKVAVGGMLQAMASTVRNFVPPMGGGYYEDEDDNNKNHLENENEKEDEEQTTPNNNGDGEPKTSETKEVKIHRMPREEIRYDPEFPSREDVTKPGGGPQEEPSADHVRDDGGDGGNDGLLGAIRNLARPVTGKPSSEKPSTNQSRPRFLKGRRRRQNRHNGSSGDGVGSRLSPSSTRTSSSIGIHSHQLLSTVRGESDIEKVAKKIMQRRDNRLPVTFETRKIFLRRCREIAREHSGMKKNCIPVAEVFKLRHEYRAKVQLKRHTQPQWWIRQGFPNRILEWIGVWDTDATTLELLDRACNHVLEELGSDERWFYFRDFNFYHTVVAQRVKMFRSPALEALVWLIAFYIGSAVLFCAIMEDEGVCPQYDDDQDWYIGWMSSIYFASVTMSTVGYGDLTLYDEENWWRTLIGTLYMMLALFVAYTVFSTAAGQAVKWAQIAGIQTTTVAAQRRRDDEAAAANQSGNNHNDTDNESGGSGNSKNGKTKNGDKDKSVDHPEKRETAKTTSPEVAAFSSSILLRPLEREYDPRHPQPLYKQVRQIMCLRVFDLFVWCTVVNLVGVFVARFFIRNSEEETEQWNWMTTIYWAVQTTTTIGYGDLDMPVDMRWFKIFFTAFGPAFAGAVFGAAASLKKDIGNLRRYYAWKRREVSKQLIEDMTGDLDELQPPQDGKKKTKQASNSEQQFADNSNDAEKGRQTEDGMEQEEEKENEMIDQYQFLVGSLLMLNKLEMRDIEPIMDKFRELSNEEGFICWSTATAEGEKAAHRADEDSMTGDTAKEDGEVGCNMDAESARF